eukprot:1158109-Pelagomonas_calceolata.AAC.17
MGGATTLGGMTASRQHWLVPGPGADESWMANDRHTAIGRACLYLRLTWDGRPQDPEEQAGFDSLSTLMGWCLEWIGFDSL